MMQGLRRLAAYRSPAAKGGSLTKQYRCLASQGGRFPERKYVRIAGPAAYATRDDVIDFMRRNGVDLSRTEEARSRRLELSYSSGPTQEVTATDESDAPAAVMESEPKSTSEVAQASDGVAAESVPVAEADEKVVASDEDPTGVPADGPGEDQHLGTMNVADAASSVDGSSPPPMLAQARSDVYMNHAIWFYEADSAADANDVVNKLTGKVCGLKLVRAAAVDRNVAKEVPGFIPNPPDRDVAQRGVGFSHRWRMSVIAPSDEERDKALLVVGLPFMVYPRTVWAFFGGYDVAAVRLLRKNGIASVIFREASEAERAMRERGNLQISERPKVTVRTHC